MSLVHILPHEGASEAEKCELLRLCSCACRVPAPRITPRPTTCDIIQRPVSPNLGPGANTKLFPISPRDDTPARSGHKYYGTVKELVFGPDTRDKNRHFISSKFNPEKIFSTEGTEWEFGYEHILKLWLLSFEYILKLILFSSHLKFCGSFGTIYP